MSHKESASMPEATLAKQSASPQSDVVRSDSIRSPGKDTNQGADALLETPVQYVDTTHQAARLAGRLNASAVTDAERNELLAERAKLLDKLDAGTITRKEEIRLEYVRWSLDRIEDARYGPAMDRLEAQIDEFQKLAKRLMGLRDNLDGLTGKRRR
jgi:hypothetical protein